MVSLMARATTEQNDVEGPRSQQGSKHVKNPFPTVPGLYCKLSSLWPVKTTGCKNNGSRLIRNKNSFSLLVTTMTIMLKHSKPYASSIKTYQHALIAACISLQSQAQGNNSQSFSSLYAVCRINTTRGNTCQC